jgi:nucleotide-binding universal stress UspA family protein
MPGRLQDFLAQDHRRLDGLLRRALDHRGRVDGGAYEELRRGLLRHIAMEEKVLLPALRRARGDASAVEKQLHRDHEALAVLLVPPPEAESVSALRNLLELHNPLEEGPGGFYEAAEQLGAQAEELLERVQAIPPVRVAPHSGAPVVRRRIAEALRAALSDRVAPPGR